ncbi:bifunctional DNA-formamidopyrimidine glycosylase/DNA-(apurinic or apyrimidinic site) lyase [Spirochaeta africana]|uniref:Formamidopyrimidine-DNA glycosylase n=1 Tax=Spirochaeta africana (strain ATCC 700263 / DSM 8902 / Z-7692) TaxID=889378 RepID=H9UI24_SPIAZ|nr:bifunctional DNA-formamidopyrimidine glycosylase/DNA-(apurinic or apyrimidinic site) lyase [Spirochaeta africana]AFG37167.1 formamidopyrimidine-DNA glycosylase Fpg [Spirochaeta africana DSM 8902]
MPEMPEVHTTIQSLLQAGLAGRRIIGAEVEWPRTVGGDPQGFAGAVRGRRIDGLQRRGKYILLSLAEPAGWLVVHLRMSGRLLLTSDDSGPYIRARLQLDDRRWLCLYAPRRFARMEYRDTLVELLQRLGPEPLEPGFTPDVLAGILAGTRRALKTVLLDQQRIAGIGNIYADEALFEAGLHPQRPAASLQPPEIARLHAAIQSVLHRGIRNLGTSLGHGKANFSLPDGESGRNQEDIRVFRRTGLPCLNCGTPIERMIIGQRSTHYCPACQQYL